MGIYTKVKWVLGVALVFLLILATNLVDRNNFAKIQYSVSTIYKDRLIAKDLILDFSRIIHEKEIANLLADSSFFMQKNNAVRKETKALISSYLDTKLTNKEEMAFSDLQADFKQLEQMEDAMVKDQSFNSETYKKRITIIKEHLQKLSNIQLAEGRRQVAISEEAIESIEVFTQLEIYILAFLAILIQIMIIYKPKTKVDPD
jgi:hypothetical protein